MTTPTEKDMETAREIAETWVTDSALIEPALMHFAAALAKVREECVEKCNNHANALDAQYFGRACCVDALTEAATAIRNGGNP